MFKRFRDAITGLYTRSRDPATTVAEAPREKRDPNHFVILITPPKGPKLKSRVAHHLVIQFGPSVVGDEATRLVEKWNVR